MEFWTDHPAWIACAAFGAGILFAFVLRSFSQMTRTGDSVQLQQSMIRAFAGATESLQEEKLINSRFRKTLENVSDGIALIGPDHELEYANAKLWQIYRVPAGERGDYIGKPWFNLHNEKGRSAIESTVLPVLQDKGFWSGQADIKTFEQVIIRAEYSILTLDKGYIGIVRDITLQDRAEQDREDMALQLQQVQKSDAVERALRRFLHDINNGLASVIGFSELLSETTADPRNRSYAESIFHAGQQMHGMVEQMRQLIPRPRQLSDLNSDLIASLPSAIGELKKQYGDVRVDRVIDLHRAEIACPPRLTCQILLHLMQNAAESTRDGRCIHVKIGRHAGGLRFPVPVDQDDRHNVETAEDGSAVLFYGSFDSASDYAELCIADEGDGIASGAMSHILDPFFSTRGGDKKGLGLSIVRSIVKRVNGALYIQSRIGSGTRVMVLLPAKMDSLGAGLPSTTANRPLPEPEAEPIRLAAQA